MFVVLVIDNGGNVGVFNDFENNEVPFEDIGETTTVLGPSSESLGTNGLLIMLLLRRQGLPEAGHIRCQRLLIGGKGEGGGELSIL